MADWREYRKTATVEAVQVTALNCRELAGSCGGDVTLVLGDDAFVYVQTREGEIRAKVAQEPYLCRGVEGEYWLVDPDIFEQTYEEVDGG